MAQFDVLAVGELNVDLIMTGFQSMPMLGREIIGDDFSCVLGSSTAICACVMANLGLSTGFYGKMGKDAFGDVVLYYLHKYNVHTKDIVTEDSRRTGITVSMSYGSDRSLVTCNGDSIDAVTADDITDDMLRAARHIHVGSFFLQSKLRHNLAGLFQRAKELGLTTSLDCGWDETGNWDYDIMNVLEYTDLFFPNEAEALHITGKTTVSEAAGALAGRCSICVIKCGPMGAYLQTGDTILQRKTYAAKVVDTTGAGDSFNAGFIYAYLKGMPLERCMEYGNGAGAVSVTRMGGTANCPGLEEVERAIQSGRVN